MTKVKKPPVSVRAVGPDDRMLVDRILIETWDATEFATCGEMTDARDLPGFIAFAGDEVVGLLTFHANEEVCELLTLNALKPWRGIGSALLDEFVKEIKGQGFSRVFLVTTNDNVDAIRFYQKRGWYLAEVNVGAVDEARRTIKPGIPDTGNYGIPIRDELVFELRGVL